MRREKKSIKRLLVEMSWQDRIFGIFLFAAAVFLIVLGMRMVGSNGVLILLGSLCFYFVTTIYRMNRDKEDDNAWAKTSRRPKGLVEDAVQPQSDKMRPERAENLIGKDTKDKHADLMGDLMGKK